MSILLCTLPLWFLALLIFKVSCLMQACISFVNGQLYSGPLLIVHNRYHIRKTEVPELNHPYLLTNVKAHKQGSYFIKSYYLFN